MTTSSDRRSRRPLPRLSQLVSDIGDVPRLGAGSCLTVAWARSNARSNGRTSRDVMINRTSASGRSYLGRPVTIRFTEQLVPLVSRWGRLFAHT